MTLETELAKAANQAPPVDICHHAVIHWLAKANVITGAKGTALVHGTKASDWGTVLAAFTDPAFTKEDLAAAHGGIILGFFTPDKMLQHSMVTMGGGLVAGVNNANVLTANIAMKVGTKYAKVTTGQLDWKDNTRVGLNQCEVRGISATALAARINL